MKEKTKADWDLQEGLPGRGCLPSTSHHFINGEVQGTK
jgi:hypothetical protein